MAGEMQAETAGTGKRMNRIPLERQIVAVEWLKGHAEEARTLTQGELALRMGGAIGHPVTVGNLLRLAQAAKVRLHGLATGSAMAVESRLHNLEECVTTLAARLNRLEKQPGLPVAEKGGAA